MKYQIVEEGFTQLLLENGDVLKFKIVIGNVTILKGQKNPDGTQRYNMQHQLVSFVIPADGQVQTENR